MFQGTARRPAYATRLSFGSDFDDIQLNILPVDEVSGILHTPKFLPAEQEIQIQIYATNHSILPPKVVIPKGQAQARFIVRAALSAMVPVCL